MFAIFLSKNMDPFYQNISSFPTALYTVLLGVCVLYWAGAVIGLVDIDILNVDVDANVDMNPETGSSTPDVLAGLLLRFGLVGVPVVISLSLIVLFGWFICYYLVHFINSGLTDGFFRFLLGLPILAVSLFAATWLTSKTIKPLRPLFKYATAETYKHIIGQTAVVRTSRVDAVFGEATLADGGAGLILKIRSTGSDKFIKGDRVVLFEKLNDDNVYRVISENDFLGL